MIGLSILRLENIPKELIIRPYSMQQIAYETKSLGVHPPAKIAPLYRIIILGLYTWSPESSNPM